MKLKDIKKVTEWTEKGENYIALPYSFLTQDQKNQYNLAEGEPLVIHFYDKKNELTNENIIKISDTETNKASYYCINTKGLKEIDTDKADVQAVALKVNREITPKDITEYKSKKGKAEILGNGFEAGLIFGETKITPKTKKYEPGKKEIKIRHEYNPEKNVIKIYSPAEELIYIYELPEKRYDTPSMINIGRQLTEYIPGKNKSVQLDLFEKERNPELKNENMEDFKVPVYGLNIKSFMDAKVIMGVMKMFNKKKSESALKKTRTKKDNIPDLNNGFSYGFIVNKKNLFEVFNIPAHKKPDAFKSFHELSEINQILPFRWHDTKAKKWMQYTLKQPLWSIGSLESSENESELDENLKPTDKINHKKTLKTHEYFYIYLNPVATYGIFNKQFNRFPSDLTSQIEEAVKKTLGKNSRATEKDFNLAIYLINQIHWINGQKNHKKRTGHKKPVNYTIQKDVFELTHAARLTKITKYKRSKMGAIKLKRQLDIAKSISIITDYSIEGKKVHVSLNENYITEQEKRCILP